MTTTKKDFERAAMLMKHHPELERAIICDYMLRFFAGSNARFDRSRFIAACGLREDSSGEIVRPRRSVQNDDVVLHCAIDDCDRNAEPKTGLCAQHGEGDVKVYLPKRPAPGTGIVEERLPRRKKANARFVGVKRARKMPHPTTSNR